MYAYATFPVSSLYDSESCTIYLEAEDISPFVLNQYGVQYMVGLHVTEQSREQK